MRIAVKIAGSIVLLLSIVLTATARALDKTVSEGV